MMVDNLDSLASSYSRENVLHLENELILNWYPSRIKVLLGRSVESLLELGIGHGIASPYFGQLCDEHVVVDGSRAVIDRFSTEHPSFRGQIVLDYFETFSPSQEFDVIVMGFVLEHVDDPELVLRKYRRHLKPGGKIYVAVPNAKSLNRRLGLELGLIGDIYSLNENDLLLGHQRQFCVETLKELALSVGLRVNVVEGIYLKPLPLKVLLSLDNPQENLKAMLRVGVEFPDLCVAILAELQAE